MAYTPTNWVDGSTPISAAKLNNIESGIASAVNLNNLLSTNGYVTLPNGLILQWGYISYAANTNSISVTFPTTFNNRAFYVGTQHTYSNARDIYSSVSGVTATGFNMYLVNSSGVIPTVSNAVFWFAIGN